MTCPKCHGSLRTVNKAGVRLEQCENCRGIFLDHGELEQILQAEQRYYGGGAPYLGSHGGHHGHRDSPRPYRDSPRPHHGGHHGHYRDSPRPYGHKRGRGSFLGDLFG
ncbi:MAG TPA: zf-TFIIB domain-containing protein [Pseudonocardiaceae bacterium]|nr:zf-TFIIB domain-containing protein [Pseudonocardiaceae bacterium]